jgi:hypothetical protein
MEHNEGAQHNEIDFRLIWGFLKSYVKYVIRNWKVLLISLIIGAAMGRFVAWFFGIKYSSTITYSIQNTNSNSSLTSALSLASSFGIGSKTTGSFDANYFSELSKSKRVIKETLLKEGYVNGKKDLLANHFYYCSKFQKKWDSENDPLYQFRFKHNKISELTSLEDSVLTIYYNFILDKFLTTGTTENNAFNRITILSPNKDFAKEFLRTQINQIQQFYQRSVENINSFNYDIASKRVDSLAEAIRIADMKVARYKDNSSNAVKQLGLVELNNAIREQSLLNIQYSAAVNNYESSKTALIATAPVIQIIDQPEFTTEIKFFDPFNSMIIGALLLLLISLGILFLMKLFSV